MKSCVYLLFVLAVAEASTIVGPTSYELGWDVAAIRTHDINSDGILDIVASSQGSGEVQVLLGRSDGTFRPRIAYGGMSNPYGLAIGDFDSDGRPDIAVTCYNGNNIVILRWSGSALSLLSTVALPGPALAIAAADFNRDGRLDLAVPLIDDAHVLTFFGNGNGTFSQGGGKPPRCRVLAWQW